MEEVLQAEAEVLATELEEAVEEGIGAELVQDVEDTVESAAEALLLRWWAPHWFVFGFLKLKFPPLASYWEEIFWKALELTCPLPTTPSFSSS